MQQATLFFLCGARECGCFYTIEEASLHLGWCEGGVYNPKDERTCSASVISFMKHAFSFTPGMPNVCVSAPTAYTR